MNKVDSGVVYQDRYLKHISIIPRPRSVKNSIMVLNDCMKANPSGEALKCSDYSYY